MDVYNPAVRSLRWKYMDSAFFGLGADAWWQDATEPGDDGNSVSGVKIFTGSANRVRNSYPLFASQATYEGQRGADSGKRVVILSRSGLSRPAALRGGGVVGRHQRRLADFRAAASRRLEFFHHRPAVLDDRHRRIFSSAATNTHRRITTNCSRAGLNGARSARSCASTATAQRPKSGNGCRRRRPI